MRKTFAILVLTLVAGTASAFNSTINDNAKEPVKAYKTFTQIDIDDLPSDIRNILFFEYKNYMVRSIEVKTIKGTNIYQITLVDNENFEYIIYINSKGFIVE